MREASAASGGAERPAPDPATPFFFVEGWRAKNCNSRMRLLEDTALSWVASDTARAGLLGAVTFCARARSGQLDASAP